MSATTAGQEFVRLEVGDPAPWFHQRSPTNPNYAFDTAAGRYIVLCFFGSAAHPLGRAALEAVVANRRHFDDHNICFFGVSLDAADEAQGRVRDSLPGLRFFWDFDGAISRRYGAVPRDAPAGRGRNGGAPVLARARPDHAYHWRFPVRLRRKRP